MNDVKVGPLLNAKRQTTLSVPCHGGLTGDQVATWFELGTNHMTQLPPPIFALYWGCAWGPFSTFALRECPKTDPLCGPAVIVQLVVTVLERETIRSSVGCCCVKNVVLVAPDIGSLSHH